MEINEFVVPGVPLMERFSQGGLTMVILLALSVALLTFAIERFCRLRRKQIVSPGLAVQACKVWESGKLAEMTELTSAHSSVLGAAIELMSRHRHLPPNEVSALVGDEVNRMMRQQLQKAYPLAIVATLAPLLGLLGTVVGMIDSFEVVAIAGSLGDASLLAGGIAKALVTTAFGLIVAIPSLGLYHYFRSKTHEFAMEVEEVVNQLMSTWFYNGAKGEAPEKEIH